MVVGVAFCRQSSAAFSKTLQNSYYENGKTALEHTILNIRFRSKYVIKVDEKLAKSWLWKWFKNGQNMSQNLKMVQNQKLFEANFEPYLDHFFAILEEFSTFFLPFIERTNAKVDFSDQDWTV